MGQVEEYSQWISTVFLPTFYRDQWYNGDPYGPAEVGYLRNYLQIIQGARIWQARVSNTTSCNQEQSSSIAYAQRFKPRGGGCYGEYDFGTTSDTKPFGPPGAPTRYQYFAPVASTVEGLSGFGVEDYGNGGYFVYLPGPENRTQGLAIAQQLLRDRFIDKQTRMVSIDANLYNPDTGYLTVSRFTVEFLKTGKVLPSYKLYSIKMLLYETPADRIRAAGEVFVVLMTLFYLWRELKQMRQAKPWYKYFLDWANFFDLSLQVLMLLCVAFWILQVTNPLRNAFTATALCTASATPTPNGYGFSTCYLDMFNLARNFQYAVTTAGVLGLCMVLKFFKFFALSRRMNTLWLTLSKAASSLAGFAVGFSLVVAGFSFFAQQAFGALVEDFHTFPSSFSTLMRYPLGDFDYGALRQSRPDIAPLFFFLYIILVLLVSMNMVIAIITAAFEDVSRGLKMEEKWKHVTSSYWLHVLKKTRRYTLMAFMLFRYVCGNRIAQVLCCCGTCVTTKSTTFASHEPRKARDTSAGALSTAATTGSGGSSLGGGLPGSGSGSGIQSKSIRINPLHAAGSETLDPVEAELNALSAEATFVALVRRFISDSEAQSHSDLLAYFEEIHKTTGSGKNLYIGLNELCALCRDPDVPLDPFCKVGHRWRLLGKFVVSKAQQAQQAGLAANSSSKARTCMRRFFCCCGCKSGEELTLDALDDLEMGTGGLGGSGSGSSGGSSSSSGEAKPAGKAAWTHNPLRDAEAPSSSPSPDSSSSSANGSASAGRPAAGSSTSTATSVLGNSATSGDPYSIEMIKSVVKPKCVAWKMIQAYNAYKDVLLLGPSERHAFFNDKSMDGGANGDEDGSDGGEASNRLTPGKQQWQVVKINRNDTRQRRCISVRPEGGTVVVYNHDLKGSMKRRFLISQVMQVEASIPNPRRCFVYIEAEPELEAGDPLSRFAVVADTVYDLLFSTPEERDTFINIVVKARAATIHALLEGDKVGKDGKMGGAGKGSGKDGSSGGTASRVQSGRFDDDPDKAAAIAKLAALTKNKFGSPRTASSNAAAAGGAAANKAAAAAAAQEEDNYDSSLTFRRSTLIALPVEEATGFLDSLVRKQQTKRQSRINLPPPPPLPESSSSTSAAKSSGKGGATFPARNNSPGLVAVPLSRSGTASSDSDVFSAAAASKTALANASRASEAGPRIGFAASIARHDEEDDNTGVAGSSNTRNASAALSMYSRRGAGASRASNSYVKPLLPPPPPLPSSSHVAPIAESSSEAEESTAVDYSNAGESGETYAAAAESTWADEEATNATEESPDSSYEAPAEGGEEAAYDYSSATSEYNTGEGGEEEASSSSSDALDDLEQAFR